METPLKQQLKLATFLGRTARPYTSHDLCRSMDISRATLARNIRELRHFGAKIVTEGRKGYLLVNWDEIEPIVTKWYRLEIQKEEAFRGSGALLGANHSGTASQR